MQAQLDALESKTKHFKSKKGKGATIQLPVVVHVLHNQEDGTIRNENISDAQIFSQIERINTDFAGTNDDIGNVPNQFKDFIADGDVFQFCLAQTDPEGNLTTGITRTFTEKTNFSFFADDAKKANRGGKDPWPNCEYINFWVVPGIDGGSTLGYASFPQGPDAEDGIVIGNTFFGDDTGTSIPAIAGPYYKGRTATHELGHYFNLYHIWGDDCNGASCSCTGSDRVSDTPNQAGDSSGCPVNASSCDSNDMTVNYMDYSNDRCLLMFTQGQSDRMSAVIESSRSCLVEAAKRSCAPPCKATEITLEVPENKSICFEGKNDKITFNTSLSDSYFSVFVVTDETTGIIKTINYTGINNFANYEPGTYGFHIMQIKFEDDDILSFVKFNETHLDDLISEVADEKKCIYIDNDNYPIFRHLAPARFELNYNCLVDGKGNNTGAALLELDLTGASESFTISPNIIADTLFNLEFYDVSVTDSLDCFTAAKSDSVFCEPYVPIGEFFEIESYEIDVNGDLKLNYNIPENANTTTYISLYSISGKLIGEAKFDGKEGFNLVNLPNFASLSESIYVLLLDNKTERISLKILPSR
ncbi:UNVERIFIED_CONTAM: hypothetical protein GTU68_023301 [Idotea baltica]|nr:hypothetical protein [Idotea baltica]